MGNFVLGLQTTDLAVNFVLNMLVLARKIHNYNVFVSTDLDCKSSPLGVDYKGKTSITSSRESCLHWSKFTHIEDTL